MAYIFGAAIKGIWGFVFPRDDPHLPHTAPTDPTTATPDPTPPNVPQAYINHTMQSAVRASAQPPLPEGPAANIPWAQIHYAHISNLRGQLRYLKFVGEKNHCTDKISAYIQRTRQALHDAKAAATAAGIIPPPTARTLPKRRRSVTFAHNVEIVHPKKPKTHPGPTGTVPRYTKRTTTRDPPSAEKLAAMIPALGKHARSPEEQEAGEKAKRGRLVYLEKKYWKPGQYEGDTTDEEGGDDDDDADFAPMPDDMGSTTSAPPPEPSAPASPPAPSAPSDKTTPPHKPTKHTSSDDSPQSTAKKLKKDVQRLIEDSSKRHAEGEEGARAVAGGDVKKQKRG